jgi:hypothetical protein
MYTELSVISVDYLQKICIENAENYSIWENWNEWVTEKNLVKLKEALVD